MYGTLLDESEMNVSASESVRISHWSESMRTCHRARTVTW